jgi:hypothetical protein
MKLSTFVVVLARACPSFPISSRSRRSFYRIALLISISFSSAQAEQPHNELLPLINQINQYAKSLESLELKQSEIHTLVLDRVLSILAPPSFEYEYWREAAVSPNVMTMSNRLDQAQRAREILIAVYGSKAIQSRAFEQLFFPINEQAEFLSSQEQIALVDQRARYDISRINFFSQNIEFSGSLRASKVSAPSHKSQFPTHSPKMAMITEGLSPESAFEWKVRYSFFADRLRKSQYDFTEQSFRDTYTLLAPIYDVGLKDSLPSGLQISRSIDALEELLGAEAAVRIQIALNPTFSRFSQTALEQGLLPDQIITVFDILQKSQIEMLMASDLMAVDQDKSRQLLNQAYRERDDNLVSFVGKQKVDVLISAFDTPDRFQQTEETHSQTFHMVHE